MLKSIFKNTRQFTLLYFTILLIDIFVKLYCPVFPYRFISKPLVIISLFIYFCFNKNKNTTKKNLWVFLALTFFFLGDLVIINHNDIVFFGLSLLFFSIGKIFFCFKFSHKNDFNVLRLVPFSIIIFAYTVFLISVLFENLKAFLVPALVSFFITLLMFQFAYLRKGVFNKKSYVYVFLGVLLYNFGESIMAVKTFKQDLPFQDFLIMLLYGTSVYFIILGIIKEKETKSIFPNPS